MTRPCRATAAFTLIELIVIMAVIALLAGLALSMPRSDRRGPPVMQAAQELAQALRQAHAMAIEHQAPVAITFNISNAPNTDGSVLNNWQGGHWYQLVRSYQMVAGPDSSGFMATYGLPEGGLARRSNKMLQQWKSTIDTPASTAVDRVRSCYVGDRVILPAKQVRFVALTDQDNGGAQYSGNRLDPKAMASWWGPTYPRPWFGNWDPVSKRLHAWGGYDHALTLHSRDGTCIDRKPGGTAMSPSGFWYEGHDGAITNSVHPRDRWIVSDAQGNDGVFMSNAGDTRMPHDIPYTFATQFFEAGKPRPLINGDWMDFTIEFHADGTVRQGLFSGLRLAYSHGANWSSTFYFQPDLANAMQPTGAPASGAPPWDLSHLGPGDMCATQMAPYWTRAYENHVPAYAPWLNPDTFETTQWASSASTYAERTGWMWITLAPDADRKTNSFSSVDDARRSLMPAVRVGINRRGDVRIEPITGKIPVNLADVYALDTELCGAQWDDNAFLYPRYHRNQRSDVNRKPLGIPADTFLTREMLELRSWWLIPK